MNQNNQERRESQLDRRVVTVTTDFGTTDGYAGIVKGVITSIAPHACIIDLTNEIAPADIEAAAWVVNNSYKFFPATSVHLAVVDPGVGSKRRSVVLVTSRGSFVGPDNGIFSLVVQNEESARAYLIENLDYCLPEIS
ncbi:MAG TPA: SAM-dependent chlorinase/fluorinase, partial [Chroococcales cyanobacterium]